MKLNYTETNTSRITGGFTRNTLGLGGVTDTTQGHTEEEAGLEQRLIKADST